MRGGGFLPVEVLGRTQMMGMMKEGGGVGGGDGAGVGGGGGTESGDADFCGFLAGYDPSNQGSSLMVGRPANADLGAAICAAADVPVHLGTRVSAAVHVEQKGWRLQFDGNGRGEGGGEGGGEAGGQGGGEGGGESGGEAGGQAGGEGGGEGGGPFYEGLILASHDTSLAAATLRTISNAKGEAASVISPIVSRLDALRDSTSPVFSWSGYFAEATLSLAHFSPTCHTCAFLPRVTLPVLPHATLPSAHPCLYHPASQLYHPSSQLAPPPPPPQGTSAPVPFDAAVTPGSNVLAFLSRDASKPERPRLASAIDAGGGAVSGELWTAVSTVHFARQLLSSGGGGLSSGGLREPGDSEVKGATTAALAAQLMGEEVRRLLGSFDGDGAPRLVHAAAKRWGAGFRSATLEQSQQSVALEPWQLVIAGDFVNGGHGSPVEAAAASGLEAGERIAAMLNGTG